MEIDWLHDFIVLAELGSFSRAAEHRGITQPAFSRRIRALECWTGAGLFTRETRHIELTAAGQQFRPIAEDLLRQLHLGRDQVQAAARREANIVRLGSTHALSLTFLPDWLSRVESRPDGVSMISLLTGSTPDCERMLVQGLVSLVMYHAHTGEAASFARSHFISLDIGGDRLIPVSAPRVKGSPEPLHSLPGSMSNPCAYLEYSSDTGMARLLSSAFEKKNWSAWLSTVFTSQNAIVLFALVQAGRGLAWLPESLAAPYLNDKVVRAGGEEWDLPMAIRLSRPARRQSEAVEALWTIAKADAALRQGAHVVADME